MRMKIGLISDTHDHFDPRLPECFRGVAHILHAGDIGQESILTQLAAIAPVTAVAGNNDLWLDLRQFELVELAARRFLVHHIVHPQTPSAALQQRLLRDPPDVLVGGHTHKALVTQMGPILFVNPGYAGRPRFGSPRSVAILHCQDDEVRPEFIPL
jgi:uncharacterized protein